MRVLVAHPGIQYAHQLAWALEEAGHLAALWSGVPLRDSTRNGAALPRFLERRLRAVPITRKKRTHDVAFPLLRKAIEKCHDPLRRSMWNHRLDRLYDAWVAPRVGRLKPDVVVCYENSALHSFRAAREVGAVCVLDAASIHYEAARHWRMPEDLVDPGFVERGKRQEIAQADAILTCSKFAADTYRDNGVPERKLFPTPLGTDLPRLPPDVTPRDGPCRFAFVGSLVYRKGVSELLEVFSDFANEHVPARLTLFGGAVERDLLKRATKLPNVEYVGFTPQDRLFTEVARQECLVLPSWFDSFGMVVPEAMAVGLPAIVSERVGAKCIIEEHPEAGWIVPCDASALKTRMLALVRNRDLVVRASETARHAATDYTWEKYRTRVVRTLEAVYDAHKHSGTTR